MVAHAAGQNTPNKLSSIDRARKMNIRILTVHSLFKWFKEVDNISKKRKQRKANPKIIMKIEDSSHIYCPEMKVLMSGYPVLNLSGDGSPFEHAEQNSYNLRSNPTKQTVGINTCKPTAALERESKKAVIVPNHKAKCGYCELCAINFDVLDKHLKSKQHGHNIQTKYQSLDSSIKKGGDFKQFLLQMKQSNDVEENANKVPTCDIKTNAITPIKIKLK